MLLYCKLRSQQLVSLTPAQAAKVLTPLSFSMWGLHSVTRADHYCYELFEKLQCVTSLVKIQVLWSSAEESERGEHLLLDEPESLHQSDCRRSNPVQRWRVLWHQWAESFSRTNRTIWHETPQRNTHVAHSQSTSGTEGWLIWVYFFKNQELTKKSTLSITPIFV